MAKKVAARDIIVKLIVGAGQASPSPPVGPALGSKGVKSMDFCKVRVARPCLSTDLHYRRNLMQEQHTSPPEPQFLRESRYDPIDRSHSTSAPQRRRGFYCRLQVFPKSRAG
jgi:hypothetical protein